MNMASIPNKRVDHKVQRQVDPFIVYGIDAAGQAIEDAGLTDMDEATQLRAGVLDRFGHRRPAGDREARSLVLAEKGPGRVSPHFVHGRLINLISGQVSIKYGLMGPNHAVVTACSTGAHSIGDAARMIKRRTTPTSCWRAAPKRRSARSASPASPRRGRSAPISTTSPKRPAAPYDKDRDGFVMGEGAGVVVLEEYEHAKARGAKIYAEVVGYGLSGDAYHVTAPHPGRLRRLSVDGNGAARSPGCSRATSTISTPTALRRRSATSLSWARCAACSAMQSPTCR